MPDEIETAVEWTDIQMDRQTVGHGDRQIEIQRDGQLERQRWRQFHF